MSAFPVDDQMQWLLASIAVVLLLVAWWIYRRRRRGNRLAQVLNEISYDRIDQLLVPNGDEGEIQIDHLLLTAQGLLIVDIKDVVGTVFGGDKMQEWTVISKERRFTFPSSPRYMIALPRFGISYGRYLSPAACCSLTVPLSRKVCRSWSRALTSCTLSSMSRTLPWPKSRSNRSNRTGT
jgi:hypothetical protein